MNSLSIACIRRFAVSTGIAGLAGVLAGACDPGPDAIQSKSETPVTVYVAASLGGAFERILVPGPDTAPESAPVRRPRNVRLIAAASSTLARQLELGAHGDVFVSANRSWTTYLQERGRLVRGSRRPLLGNRLVLVRASRNRASPDAGESEAGPTKARTFRELDAQQVRRTLITIAPAPERLCIGNPAHVPAGIYARQALEKSGAWLDLQDRVLPGADARRTLWYLKHGGCAAGIVYRTDLRAGPASPGSASKNAPVALGLLRADLHAPIVYEIALLNEASPTARDVYDFLFSREAQEIFQSLGFIALN